MGLGATVADLRLGGIGDSPCFYCWQLDFCGFCLFVLFIPLFLHVQSACVLLRFYWNFSWLDARSAFFYLRVSVNVREAQM
jgi:hypothetical protein